jgi:hypothetical protein
MKLVITTYATEGYCYAFAAQAPLILQNLRMAGIEEAVWVLASDASKTAKEAARAMGVALGESVPVRHVVVPSATCNRGTDHVAASNLVIAALQDAAWHEARKEGADVVWSLEADILPQPKALRCALDILRFDGGWYEVAMCTYPNAAYLGGLGAVNNPILPTVYEDERELTAELEAELTAMRERQAELARTGGEASAEERTAWDELAKRVKEAPAKGNVFALNAQGWRRRGWFESAYPGIGLGAILPTDWVGLGCTVLSRRALDLANWVGYEGHSTQDLWLCSRVWLPETVRMAVTSHALCSHVKRDREDKERLHLLYAHHALGGETHGHLRTNKQPFKA